MKEEIIAELGANYNEADSEIIDYLIQDVTTIATRISNLSSSDERLIPYIKEAVKGKYLARGAEGLKHRNEGSISTDLLDIEDKLRQDIIRGGLRRCY